MDRSIPLLLIGLVFGAGIGFTYAAANGITLDGHDHATDHGTANHGTMDHAPTDQMDHSAHHAHEEMLTLAAGPDAPTLDINIAPDPAAGWNLQIITSNFRFSPENASRDHIPGEGHAHVYVNDRKVGRYYGPWVHLDKLPQGKVAVKVSLNANDHRALAVGETALEQVVEISN